MPASTITWRISRNDVYGMRMARINISLPDDLYHRAKDADLNVSRIARHAITAELDRRAKIAAAYAYLAELDAELGPPTPAEVSAAEDWADRTFGPGEGRRSA
jgi:post-segregation antitoxin (ccd killing protein)